LSRIRDSWRYACSGSCWSLEEVLAELTGKTGLTGLPNRSDRFAKPVWPVLAQCSLTLYWSPRLAQEFQMLILSFCLASYKHYLGGSKDSWHNFNIRKLFFFCA
jgi:hypothetical protein